MIRKLGIAEGTFYRWKAKFGGMELGNARRLKRIAADDFTRECLAAEIYTSLPDLRVTRVLDRIIE